MTLFHHFSLNLRTLYIVWSLVRRRVTRRLTRLQTMCNALKYRKILSNVALRLRRGCVYIFNSHKTRTVSWDLPPSIIIRGFLNNWTLYWWSIVNLIQIQVVFLPLTKEPKIRLSTNFINCHSLIKDHETWRSSIFKKMWLN